jgi:hypothetical protein
VSLPPDQYGKRPEFPLGYDRPIDDTTSKTFPFRKRHVRLFRYSWCHGAHHAVANFRNRGLVGATRRITIGFPTNGRPLETIDYPLFDKERAELEAFADAVARK